MGYSVKEKEFELMDCLVMVVKEFAMMKCTVKESV